MRRRTVLIILLAVGWYFMRDAPREKPGTKTKWTIWYIDTFDRDAPATKEAEGTGILDGFRVLWKKTVKEAVDDKGDGTFTRFSMSWDGPMGTVDIHVDPFDNHGLAKIRRWFDDDLHERLSQAHARLLDKSARWDEDAYYCGAESKPILEAAVAADDRADFVRRLDGL